MTFLKKVKCGHHQKSKIDTCMHRLFLNFHQIGPTSHFIKVKCGNHKSKFNHWLTCGDIIFKPKKKMIAGSSLKAT